jgi:hypothetical protein
LAMHSKIIGLYHHLQLLETRLQCIVDHPGVWYLCYAEAARDWLKQRLERWHGAVSRC